MTVATRIGRINRAIACDAFRSSDDGLLHAIVLAADGSLTDVVYDERGTPLDSRPIAIVPEAQDVTAFWSDGDEVRNVITASRSGEVSHFSQEGSAPWTRTERGPVPGAMRVAGHDDHHHGLVLTESGAITDRPFHGVSAAVLQAFNAGNAELDPSVKPATLAEGAEEQPIDVANIPAAVDIAALWTDERFLVAVAGSGEIREIGYGAHQPASDRVLGRLAAPKRVSACYTTLTADRIVSVLLESGAVYELRYRDDDAPRIGAPLLEMPAVDIASFVAGEGTVHHVLLSDEEIVDIVAG